MRWFIEVSSVEGGESDAQYCVDAKQWQSALQQARKLRGDAGPLSTFSIELLDNGYRAVDRKQKLRYVVKKAPNDAPLNDGKNGTPNPAAEAAASTAPGDTSVANAASVKSGPPPRPRLESARPSRPSMSKPAPAKAAGDEPGRGGSAAPAANPATAAEADGPSASVPVSTGQASAGGPATSTAAARAASTSPGSDATRASSAAPGATDSKAAEGDGTDAKAVRVQAIMGQANGPRPASVRPPDASGEAERPAASEPPPPSVAAESVPPSQAAAITAEVNRAEKAASGEAKSDEPQAASEEPVPLTKTRQHDATPPPAAPNAAPLQLKPVVTPDAEVIRARGEEPTKETPITYRELALAVKPGTSREGVEALLWERYRALTKEIESRPRGKFVQLAVFDHVFSKKPSRPPLALFLWKDWRGDPVLTFPGLKNESGHVDSPQDLKDKIGSLRPTSVIPIGPATSSPPAKSDAPRAASAPAASPSAPAPATPPAPMEQASESASPRAEPSEATANGISAEGKPSGSEPARTSAAATAEPAPTESAGEPAVGRESAEVVGSDDHKAAAEPAQSAEKVAAPGAQKSARRRIGEDLIGDLFESMHELHFMADVVAGSEFVLSVVEGALPSELSLIQVFDINTGQFVVVRQTGGNPAVLMHQTPDSDAFVHEVMKAPRARNVVVSTDDDYFKKGRWQVTGVAVKHALSGAVRQGGRYLGLIELANPMGPDAYHESEANALEYICEQFAEFLANRPIVLDADVILRKS